jgi:hypothetical protein
MSQPGAALRLFRTSKSILRLFRIGFLFLMIMAPATAQVIPAQDEFVGPFASWLNAKTGYGAVGDGVHDDTANLQNCINAWSSSHLVCYIPAGTYKITSTLFIKGAPYNFGLVGHDPADTILKYAGAAGQIMVWCNGCRQDRIERITFDGSGTAGVIGLAYKWDHTNVPTGSSTHHVDMDLQFKNLDKGIAAGGAPLATQAGQAAGASYCTLDSEGLVRRNTFSNIATAGVSIECVNALDWVVWDSTFTNTTRGITNEFGSGGQFSAYRNVFKGSSVADITVANPYYYWMFSENWSVGSNQFFKATSGNTGCNILLKRNTIINTTQNVSIDAENRGPFLLVDNVIVTRNGNTGPVVNTTNSEAQIISVGNTFTVANAISGGIQNSIDDTVVSPGSVSQTPPTLPPADPQLNRTIFEVPAGADAAAIQTAINNAAAADNRSVVHLPAGTYGIASTLTVPANTPIQIVGDGWGTQLNWTGGANGVMWSLTGPNLAKFDSLSMSGSGNADLIRVNSSDQPQGYVYGSFVESDDNQTDYLTDGTINTNVDLEYAFTGVTNPTMVGLRSIGAGGTSRIALFGVDTGSSAGTLYSVRSGGKLVVEDVYYEGAILPLVSMGASENGNFSLAAFKGGVESASCANSPAAFLANGITGNFSLISGSSINCGSYQVSGSNASQNFLGIGLGYMGTSANAGFVNNSTAQAWGFTNNTLHDVSGAGIAAPNSGTTSVNFIRSMLAQWRDTHPSYLNPQVSGTTNVRVFRTKMTSGLVGLHVMAGGSTTAPDTTPPSVPGNLTATANSSSQINLRWTASTDNVGVTGYLVERCQGVGCTNFAHISTTSGTTTTYSDTGLAANTSYSYQVRATDGAGHLSPYSNLASTTTTQGTAPQGTPPQGTNSGLVAAYGFNEGKGTTVTDASGNGNTGTITNATWTTGKFGSALLFNGTNALVTILDAASLHLTTAMTLEAWVNPGTVTSQWRDVIYKGNDNYFLEATSNKSVPAGSGTFGTANVVTYGTTALPQNAWSHLALTYDGATLRLYVNGVQVSSQARTGNILTSTNPLQIGGDTFFGQFFTGIIDEVRVYNVALTAAQIQTDMTTAIGGASTSTSCGCDLNGDGAVNIVDVQKAINELLGLTVDRCNRSVTIVQVQAVINAALGASCAWK